jgi:hypothetical protein
VERSDTELSLICSLSAARRAGRGPSVYRNDLSEHVDVGLHATMSDESVICTIALLN